MLFSEVYGSYFNAVARILTEATKGTLTQARIREIAQAEAFDESVIRIPEALSSGEWPLLTDALTTPLRYPPSMPLTTLQRRWLKSLLSDPRIRLFDPPQMGLEEVELLYDPDVFVFFDCYSDGDPYEDPTYIENFRKVLTALREQRELRVRFHGGTGIRHSVVCAPYQIEYSRKDDKFRLLALRGERSYVINVARIRSCEVLDRIEAPKVPELERRELVLLLRDERNALERVMLHFSDLEKETTKLDEITYRIALRYREEDETELLIRVLGFGPLVKVVKPVGFAELIRTRLEKQPRLA